MLPAALTYLRGRYVPTPPKAAPEGPELPPKPRPLGVQWTAACPCCGVDAGWSSQRVVSADQLADQPQYRIDCPCPGAP